MTTESPALTAQEQWMKEAVDRFLQWPLPESVYPDAGKFDATNNRWRSGTNLLSADEARQMLEYVGFADDAHFGEISDHLFVEHRGDGIWLVCVEKVHESMESAQQSCRRWKAKGRTFSDFIRNAPPEEKEAVYAGDICGGLAFVDAASPAPAAQPIEPAEPVAWMDKGPWGVMEHNGRVYAASEDFTHDVVLRVDGDFGDVDQRRAYAAELCNRLNAAPQAVQPIPLMSDERRALAELVACKDLKQRAEALIFTGPLSSLGEGWEAEYNRLRKEYINRQPVAWDRARALLAEAQKPDTQVHQVSASGVCGAKSALSESHAQLATFYGVGSLAELVDKQAYHIEKLQARLPPTHDVFAPQQTRKA